MSYENFISHRYLTASKGRFLTFLNIVSIVGIAIGVASLIVVIGVMTGFGNNLREKIIGTTPHIMVEKETGVDNYNEVTEKIRALKGVAAASPYVQGNIFIEYDDQAAAMVVRGIDARSENQITKVSDYLIEGSLSDLKKGTVLVGSELARFYGFQVGDMLTVISPGTGLSGEGWRFHLAVSGIFKTNMSEIDTKLLLVNLSQAQEIFGLKEGTATGVGVKLNNPYRATDIKKSVYDSIGYQYLVRTWIDINRNLFEALFLEKWGLFLILTLMVLVASFNIISTLIVTVSSKVHDIGILKSIGVSRKSIRRIFVKQGVLIGVYGIFWGLFFGLGISYLLKYYFKVPEQIYSIDHVPVEIRLFDIVTIVGAAFVISYLATLYPSAKAANLQPVEALRYE